MFAHYISPLTVDGTGVVSIWMAIVLFARTFLKMMMSRSLPGAKHAAVETSMATVSSHGSQRWGQLIVRGLVRTGGSLVFPILAGHCNTDLGCSRADWIR